MKFTKIDTIYIYMHDITKYKLYIFYNFFIILYSNRDLTFEYLV